MNSLNISTMTAITAMPCDIDLKQLYNNIRITNIIRYIELSKDIKKGVSSKKAKKPRKDKEKKVFFNQLTFNIYYNKNINIKIFNNGKIQMTGLKKLEWGKKAVNILIDTIFEHDTYHINKSFINCTVSIDEFKKYVESKYSIVLINSNFEIKSKINRNNLHIKLIENNIFSSYESCNYPGVNIKFFYNNSNKNNDGVCYCENICNGKGMGQCDGDCKRVTVAVFYSGSIIITGARNIEQLFHAKRFITNIINKYKDEVLISKDEILIS